MAISKYTTTIEAGKTVGEIQQFLASHGAKKIVIDYDDDNNPFAITFMVMVKLNPMFFSLPSKYDGVLKAMDKDKSVPAKLRTKEQALRVSWRIIKDWIVAQMSIIEAELASMEEVFLPYAVTKDGETFFNKLEKSNFKLLE